MEDIVLVGYGGHAKSVADCIVRQNKYCIAGYIDLKQCISPYKYLGTDSVLETIYERGVRNAVLSIGYLGNSDIREKLYNKIKSIGFELPIIIDPSAVVSETAEISEGTFVGKNSVINAEAKIGKMAIINTCALVEHECVIEDFAHVAVAATLCGQVTVEKAAFIGAGATVIQGKTIPARQIVPAGAVIRKIRD